MTPGGAFLLGLRAVLPILVGVAPFGVIYGVVALQSGIPPLVAMAMSSIVFGSRFGLCPGGNWRRWRAC